MTSTCLIFNVNSSGADDARQAINRFAGQADCRLCESKSPENAARFARDALRANARRIIVAGGDGAIHQVVNELAPQFDRVELGIIPLGAGNDLARSLDIPLDDLGAALGIAQNAAARAIDVVRVLDPSESFFLNAASGGFGGEVTAHLAAGDKQRWGAFAYWMTATSRLVDLHPHEVTLTFDGDEITDHVYGLTVANGRFVGGGFPIASDALLDDGLLDVTIIPELPPLEMLSAGLEFFMGSDRHAGHLIRRRARAFHMRSTPSMTFSLDGESQQEIEASFEAIPRALRVATGPNPALR